MSWENILKEEDLIKLAIERSKPFTSLEDFLQRNAQHNTWNDDKGRDENVWWGITRLSLKGKLNNIDDFVNAVKKYTDRKRLTPSQGRIIRTLLDGTLDEELQERLKWVGKK